MLPRPRHAALLAALAAALALVAGAVDDGPARARGDLESAGRGCAPGGRGDHFRLRVRVSGNSRSAWVALPPGARGGAPRPLLVALHGAGGSGRFMEAYSGLTPPATGRGFVVAYPESEGKFWQLQPGGGGRAHDDVAFLRALAGRLESSGCADPARVYVTGVSNGGGLAARMACEASDVVAAVAPVAGTYRTLPPCRPDRPVSLLEVHGTEDETVPYSEVGPFVRRLTALDRCGARTVSRRLAPHTLLEGHPACAAGTAVEHVVVVGGTHAWPGTPLDKPGHGGPFAAARYVVRFLAGRRLAAP